MKPVRFRSRSEPRAHRVIDTRLADRTGRLETQEVQEIGDDAGLRSTDSALSPSAKKGGKAGATPPPPESITNVRQDLAQAQQMRADLQARLGTTTEELEKLQARSKADNKRLNELNAERNHLSIRLKDRDAELRGKAKLLEVCR